MCGIAGTYGRRDAERMTAMLENLGHRGPDGRGAWQKGRHTFGHTRLSIIDLAGGSQPMGREDGSWHVTFNGEIYNYRELRRSLGEENFRTHSDTEVLLELAVGGESPLQWVPRLDGMFAFALAHGHDLLLARDPLGIKPLYFGSDGAHAMVFASELKALPASTRNIVELPPGHLYSPSTGLAPFYHVPVPTDHVDDSVTAQTGLRHRLAMAVVKRLVADVPVGVFLSGGLDSSLIAALARRHKNPLETFAVCTEDGDDRRPAREVAEYLGTIHHEHIYTVQDAIEALPEVIYYLESFDFALVRSAIPNFFLAKLARKHVKVALSGEGADELFAGYDYLKTIAPDCLPGELHQITSSLHNTNLQRCDRMSMAHGLEVRVPFLDIAVVDYAFGLSTGLKQNGPLRTEKWILRKVAEDFLPASIAWRKKSKFAIGSGLGDQLARYAEAQISDGEFARKREIGNGNFLRSKEELFYYRLFAQMYPREELLALVGRSRSV